MLTQVVRGQALVRGRTGCRAEAFYALMHGAKALGVNKAHGMYVFDYREADGDTSAWGNPCDEAGDVIRGGLVRAEFYQHTGYWVVELAPF